MGKIISSKKSNDYKIEKFVFKKFGGNVTNKKVDLSSIFATSKKKEKDTENQQQINIHHEEKNQELLNKIDELSSQVVEFQMQLEEEKKSFEAKLIKAKDESYKEGLKDAKEQNEQEIEELKIQYLSSITKLQELDLEIVEKLTSIEEELIETSIIIANKVIKKEVEENSSSVAKSIAEYLISSLKDEISVKILVNPADFENISNTNLKASAKIIADSSVERGGVIILSPKKNIDGTIATRFKKTLQLIKES